LFYTSLLGSDPDLRRKILQEKERDSALSNVYGFQDAGLHSDLYRAYIDDGSYHWGSNQPRANYGNTNVDALIFLPGLDRETSASYRGRAIEILHYFHGVNPFGMVYLTNMKSYGATYSLNAIFHSWFHVNEPRWGDVRGSAYGPPPGYVPGGPNAEGGFSVDLAPPRDQPLQKSFRDWNGSTANSDPQESWRFAEPGIYYQAAYIQLLSYFAR
jgi:hypothetical protein